MRDLGRFGAALGRMSRRAHVMGLMLQMGWLIALALFVPLGLGLFLDHRLATPPLFVLIGACAGIVAGTVTAVRVAGHAIEQAAHPAADSSAAHDAVGAEDGEWV